MRFAELAGMYYPEDVVRPGDTCVEIGSYDGKNLRESELWSPTANWYLFEPSPILFPELRERFEGENNTRCCNMALADKCGPVAFYGNEERGTGNGIYTAAGELMEVAEGVTMEVMFMDLIKDIARLMLVNCEGAEFDIFRDQVLAVEWLTISFHRDKHPDFKDGRQCVARDLTEQFETVAWFHEETRCQIWVGHNREIR